MFNAKFLIVPAGIVALATAATAQSFTLRVDPHLLVGGSTQPTNPQSVTFSSGALGVGTSVFTSTGGGFMSAFANVGASIIDANDGTVAYNDGFNTINAPGNGAVDFGEAFATSTSEYSFSSATAIVVTVNWTTTVSSVVNGNPDPTAFGMSDAEVGLDGNTQIATFTFPTPETGTFTFSAGAGNHVLSFDDFSNLSGGLGNRTSSIDEQLTYSIQAVPEPASLGILAAGLCGLIARRRNRKA